MAHDPYYDLITLPPEPAFAPQRTALLTIDLQYLDAHPSGWMGRLCRDQGKPDHLKERFEFIQEILPNVRRLQDACREHGVEVIHIRVAYRTRNGRDGRRALSADLANVTLMDARDDDFLEEVAPVGDEIVIDKTSAGTFNSTSIDQILRNMNINRLWVTGIVTEGCVEMTARDAADRGFLVTLVSDGCASSTHIAHEDALQRMGDGGLIKVCTVDELIAQLTTAPAAVG
jgi:nicotinamidase-related amidase